MRRSLDRRFDQQSTDQQRISPDIVAEVDDSALLNVIGAERDAVMPTCVVVVEQTIASYRFTTLDDASCCV